LKFKRGNAPKFFLQYNNRTNIANTVGA